MVSLFHAVIPVCAMARNSLLCWGEQKLLSNNGRVSGSSYAVSSYAVNNCNFLYSNFLYNYRVSSVSLGVRVATAREK